MKLLSYSASGSKLFGTLSGDRVVTLDDRIGQPTLQAALAAGPMPAMKATAAAEPDRKLGLF